MVSADLSRVNSFLVIRLGAIGDVLRVLPAVRRLRTTFPEATIGWAVEEWAYPILAGNPNIDRFHILNRSKFRNGLGTAVAEIRRMYKEVTACNYDISLDFHGRAKSGVFSYFSGAKLRIGFGFGHSTEANFIFNNCHVKVDDPDKNRVLRFLNLLEPLGGDTSYDPDDHGIYLLPENQEKALSLYHELGSPSLAVYPGSSKRQATYHRWPPEKWVELLKRVGSQGISSVVFWGPDERELAQGIVEKAGSNCSLAPSTSLVEMMALLKYFSVFIGSNTAAMHMAWMQGVPTAVFVGPATPRRDAPHPPYPSVVLQAEEYLKPGRRKRDQSEVTTAVAVEDAELAVTKLFNESQKRSCRETV